MADETKTFKDFWANKKWRYSIIALILALLIAGGVAIALSSQANEGDGASGVSTETVSQKSSEDITVKIQLDDWNENSTPALLEINDGVNSTFKAIASSEADNIKLDLGDGEFTITLISPINADGSIYILGEPQKAKSGDTIVFTGVKLPAENVTDEQINAIKDAFSKAKDAGKVDDSVVKKVENNANAGTDARNSKTEEEKQAAQDTAKQEQEQKQESADSQSSGGSSSGSTSTASGNSGSSSSSSSSGSSSSGNSGNSGSASSGNSGSSTPAHEHSWTPVYKTVHHDAVTKQEPVYEEVSFCTDCGAMNPSREHLKNHVIKDDLSGGTYEKYVQTGTKTVTVTAAYDEQVLDHYACSCGATK